TEDSVRHQFAAVGRAPALLRVPITRVTVAQHFLRQLESGIDLLQRRQESAVVELDRPLRIERHQVVGTLTAPHCVARLFEDSPRAPGPSLFCATASPIAL